MGEERRLINESHQNIKDLPKSVIPADAVLDFLNRLETLIGEYRSKFSEGLSLHHGLRPLYYNGKVVGDVEFYETVEEFRIVAYTPSFSLRKRPIIWLKRHFEEELGVSYVLNPSGRITAIIPKEERKEKMGRILRVLSWVCHALDNPKGESDGKAVEGDNQGNEGAAEE